MTLDHLIHHVRQEMAEDNRHLQDDEIALLRIAYQQGEADAFSKVIDNCRVDDTLVFEHGKLRVKTKVTSWEYRK
jgi:hypothetical protein